jgi:hypothetical protein
MDVRILGENHYLQSALQSLREKTIQMYLAGRGAHAEWTGAQRLEYAMKVEQDNQVFAGEMLTSLPMTPYLKRIPEATSRIVVNRDMVNAAKAAADADAAAGRMTAAQKVTEMTNLEAWRKYFDYKDNAKAVEDAAERTKRK